jgi:hypothetical protein
MHESVKRYATRTDGLGCNFATIGWDFHDVQFDVVAYNNGKNELHVVECKRGAKSTDIGHAFGQLLEYKAIIHENGYASRLSTYIKTLKPMVEDWKLAKTKV